MDDDSMTVDYDGIVTVGTIRSKMIQMILEGYNRVYRRALETAVEKAVAKAAAENELRKD